MSNKIPGIPHILVFAVSAVLFITGCGPSVSSPVQIEEFKKAGPVGPPSEAGSPEIPENQPGPYRVISGDILEFQLPAALRVISADLSEWLRPVYGHKDVESYLVRVDEKGDITMPIVGKLAVAGRTLAEVESSTINAYYPKYVVNPPMVVCEVKKYQNESERIFTVMGLVNDPKTFPYPPDVQYNLMEALAFAGGLDMVADPRYVKIYRQNTDGHVLSATIRVGDKYFNDAYAVMIKPGDVVYVDHTFGTRVNKFMSDVFHITVGADIRADRGN